MLDAVLLVAIGFGVGVYSTALGAGGAFLLTPLLLIRHPEVPPEYVATASLSIVVLSSGLSAVQAVRSRRLDLPVVAVLLVAVVPTAILGAATTAYVPRREFQLGFSVFMFAMAVYLLLPRRQLIVERLSGWRRLVETREGMVLYTFPVLRGVIAATAASYLSSLAGIGGGPLYTPLEIRVMRIPVLLAVPTAHVMVAALGISGLALHLATGHIGEPMRDAPWLAIGSLAGNPLGRHVGRKLGEGPVVRLLVVGIILVAARTAWGAL